MNAVDPISAAAVDWMVRLTSGRASETDRAAFGHWLEADARHREAWAEVESLLAAPVAVLQQAEDRAPGQLAAARRALSSPPSSQRRRLLGGGLALLMVTAAGFALQRREPLRGLVADIATATGERLRRTLPDGSALTLNARTVVDLDFSAQRRRLQLREGELLIDIAPDTRRPFEIVMPRGSAQSGAGRLLVKHGAGHDLIVALRQPAFARAADAQQHIAEGQAAALHDHRIERLAQPQQSRAAWVDGLLDVRDQPLGEVIEALRAYRRGLLRIAADAADLRVFGIFHLDDTEAALRTLAETLPITVRRYGAWLTVVERRVG